MPYVLGAIAVIAVVGAVLYGYWLWLGWLTAEVVPDFFYGAAVLGSLVVPLSYAFSLWLTFSRGHASPWNLPFAIVFWLVALLYVDLLYLGLSVGVGVYSAWVAEALLARAEPVVDHWAPNRMLLAFLDAALRSGGDTGAGVAGGIGVDPYRGVWFSFVAKSALVVPLVILARGQASPLPDSEQPARVSYFFRQAWVDLWKVRDLFFDRIVFLLIRPLRELHWLFDDSGWWLIVLFLPLWVGLGLGLAIAFSSVALQALVFIVVHAAVLVLIWLLARLFASAFHWSERAVIRLRYGDARCPHAACYEAVRAPVFLCPACGEAHDRLVPGRCGVLVRTCQCGAGRLPTLFAWGKGRLRSICPACRGPLHEELFRGSVHVPIYGGPSAGKTMYMMAATWEMVEGRAPDVQAALIGDADAGAYADRWRPEFESGFVRDKTASSLPNAFLLSIRRGPGTPIAVYFYDPAGEALQDAATLEAHGFMRHVDGLMLLIDPLALSSFERKYYQEGGGPDLKGTTSREDPEETLARVVNQLEYFGVLSSTKTSALRLAVVLTKADVRGFEEAFGIEAIDTEAGGSWKDLGAERSSRIRGWFAAHESRLLDVLETRFRNVRFFAVSALGRVPDAAGGGGAAFSPHRVMEPLAWLFSMRSKFARPRLDRWCGYAVSWLVPVVVLSTLCAVLALPVAWGHPFASRAMRTVFGQPIEAVAAADSVQDSVPPTAAPVAVPPSDVDVRASREAEDALHLDRAAWRRIQVGLVAAGSNPGLVDGIPGDNTRAAIRDWQMTRGVAPTGHLDGGQVEALKIHADAATDAVGTAGGMAGNGRR